MMSDSPSGSFVMLVRNSDVLEVVKGLPEVDEDDRALGWGWLAGPLATGPLGTALVGAPTALPDSRCMMRYSVSCLGCTL